MPSNASVRAGKNQRAEARLAGWLTALAVAALLAVACDEPEKDDHSHEDCDAAARKCARETARSGMGHKPCEEGCGDEPATSPGQHDAGIDAGEPGCVLPPGCPPVVPPDPVPDAQVPEPDAGDGSVADGGDGGDGAVVEPKVIGVDFVAVDTVTQSGQTVAHLALTGLTNLPNDHGVLVWEKAGRIAHYLIDGDRFVLQGEIRFTGYYTGSDCGLVSIAVDPDWEQNGFLYAGHCTTKTESAVTRLEFHGDDYEAAGATAKQVLSFGDPTADQAWHNVGAIGFFDDPEHSMWVLAGEKTRTANAQNLSNDLGAILRIIPNRDPAGSGYVPHPGNPFAGGDPADTSSPNLYAWGLRSPWRGSIDALNRIWIGDVGSNIEEVNLATAPGQNFGWGIYDGPCAEDDPGCAGLINPLASWNHSSKHLYRREDSLAAGGTKRCVWVGKQYESGGPDVYEGFLDGAVLAGDMCVGWVRAFAVDESSTLVRDQQVGHLVGVSGMLQGADGYLYVTSFGSCSSATLGFGGLYRVIPVYDQAPPPPDDPPPSGKPLVEDPLGPLPLKLSETGIFADATLTEPIARAVRFEPLLPLWSDGLDKDRWLLLPEGTQIDNSDRKAWQFPAGTLFFKTFRSSPETGEGSPVETRIIRKTADGWDYNAYMWRDADADLLALDVPLTVAIETAPGYHDIPSRFDCHSCHDSNDTAIIGFDELRLNGPRTGGSLSQLVELDEAGLFTQPIPAIPEALAGANPLSVQVVGYLHGNCAHCHNGSPNAQSVLSLEHEQSVDNVINQVTQAHGQAEGIRVIPGDPVNSVLFQAFSGETSNPDVQPMPPVGVAARDSLAIEMLRSWISGLPAQ